MATEKMNEFRITNESGKDTVAIYMNAKEAVNAFDTDEDPVTQIVRSRIGIQVGIPDTAVQVTFRTVIGGSGAESAGCKATPSTFEVLDGTSVIFEAMAAEGYTFVGWYIGAATGSPVSAEAIAEIEIQAVIGASQDVIITAQFAPVVAP